MINSYHSMDGKNLFSKDLPLQEKPKRKSTKRKYT